MLNNVVKWFRHQRVRQFEFHNWISESVDLDSKQAFYRAIFNSDSLEKLTCCGSLLSDIDFSQFTLKMRLLVLKCQDLGPRIVSALSTSLSSSRVVNLTLGNMDYGEDFLQVLQNLLQTSIQVIYFSSIAVSAQSGKDLSTSSRLLDSSP
ncbi:hypothetical protein AC1031_005864 [Aphanomyces cochlioides]|nr:hypothetical protein AC1031_005864 [Aphanomyces cochlioides]